MTRPSKRFNLAGALASARGGSSGTAGSGGSTLATEGLLDPVFPPPSSVARALRLGMRPADRAFDQFLPRELQVVSSQYWTPLDVVIRASEWLDELDVRTVVDIGSGAGKFCVAAALASRAELVIGVEQRPRLVAAARDLARILDVEARVDFIHGAFGATPVPVADAYYMYNPFGENLFGPEEHLDSDVELGDARYQRDVAAVEQLLSDARVGTYLLTYNGFGGVIPEGYRAIRSDIELRNPLCMWRKTDHFERAQRSRDTRALEAATADA